MTQKYKFKQQFNCTRKNKKKKTKKQIKIQHFESTYADQIFSEERSTNTNILIIYCHVYSVLKFFISIFANLLMTFKQIYLIN